MQLRHLLNIKLHFERNFNIVLFALGLQFLNRLELLVEVLLLLL